MQVSVHKSKLPSRYDGLKAIGTENMRYSNGQFIRYFRPLDVSCTYVVHSGWSGRKCL